MGYLASQLTERPYLIASEYDRFCRSVQTETRSSPAGEVFFPLYAHAREERAQFGHGKKSAESGRKEWKWGSVTFHHAQKCYLIHSGGKVRGRRMRRNSHGN